MKTLKLFDAFFLCLFFCTINAQNNNQCAYCNMNIHDDLHKALAEINNNTHHFDAIECLVNYIQTKDEGSTELKVTDYNTHEMINASQAIYLKSKAIPSPMGAYLSAFKTKEDAIKMKNEKGGELFTWDELRVAFKTASKGELSHVHHHFRPDAHAPIGIMGDHLHPKGEFMVSIRYMNMTMEGNKTGTDNIDNASIYNSFMVAPQKMIMNMYMIGVMYAPSDKFSIMAMQNFTKKDMDLTARMLMNGMPMLQDFSTTSSGLGDLKLGALYGIFNNHKTSLHLNVSVNIPIGDIENRDDTPTMNNAKLPYSMQLAAATFGVTLGATYKENYSNTSWGTQFLSTFNTGKNSQNYRLGNNAQLNIWGAYKLSSNVSFSVRVLGISEGKITGMDSELNPMMVTTANNNNYGSDKIKTFFGVNLAFPQTSSLKDLRFGIEAGTPIYENYNGIQMNENFTLNFGVKYNIF